MITHKTRRDGIAALAARGFTVLDIVDRAFVRAWDRKGTRNGRIVAGYAGKVTLQRVVDGCLRATAVLEYSRGVWVERCSAVYGACIYTDRTEWPAARHAGLLTTEAGS